MKNIIARIMLGAVLIAPFTSIVGCGGSTEVSKPEVFAPKPPPEEAGDSGKKGKMVAEQDG